MANRNTKIRGAQILDEVAGGGLVKDSEDNFEINVDDSTIEVDTDVVRVKDLGIVNGKIAEDTIAESKLDIHNAPVLTYVLGYTSNGLEWIDPDVEGIQNGDLVFNEVLALDTGSDVDMTLANSPVAGTVTVYLNGLLQQPGTGEDYTISGSVITFADDIKPTKDNVLANYVIV